jgi:hypothetical protein
MVSGMLIFRGQLISENRPKISVTLIHQNDRRLANATTGFIVAALVPDNLLASFRAN